MISICCKQILASVRKIILNWSLKLEEDGILGEGMTFSSQEREIAANSNYNINYYINQVTHSQFPHGDLTMSEDRSMNIQAGRDTNISGVLTGGDISGTVTNTITNLQSANNSDIFQVLNLLQQLKTLVESEAKLTLDDKEIALEQVAVLENEVQKPDNKSGFKPVKTAIAALKGIAGTLPPATELVKGCNQLIPAITELFDKIFH